MHPLLMRQLKRAFKQGVPVAPELETFIAAVDQAYQGHDEDLRLLERTLALASRETEERNRALQADIARREKAESAREGFFRTSPDMVAVVDRRFRFVERNSGWSRDLGYSEAELDGLSIMSLIHPEDATAAAAEATRVIEGAMSQAFEFRVKHRNGSWRWVSVAACLGVGGCFYVVGRDVTEQRRMASELAQSNKLEAVGQLASGVAHEINTPVQYVGDNIDFAAEGFEQLFEYLEAVQATLTEEQRRGLADAAERSELDYFRDELPRSLKEARDGVRRVAELVRALKEFAHPDSHERSSTTDVNRVIERTVTLARGETKHICPVVMSLESTQVIHGHEGSLSQVFLNLVVNAAHAVEEAIARRGPGPDRILLSTRDEAGSVVISISDTGAGIPDAIRERIFEPFFTTKPMGKGTGQGLPLVRKVVTGHGGTLTVESTVGVGTTFFIRLPASAEAAREAA